MANLFTEKRVSITDVAKRENIHVSTVWRWILQGCRGTKLESILVGGKRFTSEEALARFVARINGQPDGPPIPTVRQRERAVKAAHDYLANEGM